MPMFINNDELDPQFLPEDASKPEHERDTIYIRRHKMNMGMQMRVQGAAAENYGNGVLTMLDEYIVKWSGPSFQGVPCTPANIRKLDPEQPLVDFVVNEIKKRNPQLDSPDPNLPLTSGSIATGEAESNGSVSASSVAASEVETLNP